MDKRLAGMAVIAIALFSLGIWEFWGRENLSYEDVPVLKEDMPANTLVREEDIKFKKMESPSPNALTSKDVQRIVGMETAQFVAGGSELYSQYFRRSQFAVGGDTGKKLFSVPEDWLLSVPQGLRRGDKVLLHMGNVQVIEGIVAHAFDSSGQEVISTEEERLNASSVVKNFEIIATEQELRELSRLGGEGGKFTVIYDYGR